MNLETWGPAGVIVVAMAWFILKIMKDHREEREQWSKAQERRDNAYTQTIENNTKAVNNSNNVTTSLKTLIETLYKK